MTLIVLIIGILTIIINVLNLIINTAAFYYLCNAKKDQQEIINAVNKSISNFDSDIINRCASICRLIKTLKTDNEKTNEMLNKIYSQQKQDYIRIAEETFRLHDRITRIEVKDAKLDLDIIDKTPNHVRESLNLDPIESGDDKYVPGLERIDDSIFEFDPSKMFNKRT